MDVERINPDFGTREIAERFFSPHEIEELRGLPVDQQVLGFFNCWTRKEAFIKALGRGLSVPLDSFDVTLAPAEPSRLLATREDSRVRDSWKLYSTEPAPGIRRCDLCGRTRPKTPILSVSTGKRPNSLAAKISDVLESLSGNWTRGEAQDFTNYPFRLSCLTTDSPLFNY